MLNPQKKYNLDYYLSLADKIVGMGAHILGKLNSNTNEAHLTNSFLMQASKIVS